MGSELPTRGVANDVCPPPYSARLSPPVLLLVAIVLVFSALAAAVELVPASQATLNGLVAGGYMGLGAIGLTLVMGVLKLVNFAHGDLLVAGAYFTILFAYLGMPLLLAMALSMIATALLSLATEKLVWRPLRSAGAGHLQLFLSAIGLALVLRFSIQFVAGSQVRTLGANVVSSIVIGPLRFGTLQAAALAVGLVAMLLVGLVLRYTNIGKEMRAFADNRALAEVSGINTNKIIDVTWIASGFLAGLAGILYATAIGSFNPNFGITLLLSLFAATVLGGIGNAYGALAGGLVIGLSQEWSTLFFNPRWKPAVGFALLILILLFMPRGIFGRAARALMSIDFWIGVGVLAGIYGIFTLGLQLNVGFTGLLNFGQAGFMAIGAYAMGCWSSIGAGRSGRRFLPASFSPSRPACSSAFPRCGCGRTISPWRPSPLARSSATPCKTPNSPAVTRVFSASIRSGAPSPTGCCRGWLSAAWTNTTQLPLFIVVWLTSWRFSWP